MQSGVKTQSPLLAQPPFSPLDFTLRQFSIFMKKLFKMLITISVTISISVGIFFTAKYMINYFKTSNTFILEERCELNGVPTPCEEIKPFFK